MCSSIKWHVLSSVAKPRHYLPLSLSSGNQEVQGLFLELSWAQGFLKVFQDKPYLVAAVFGL